MRKRMQPEFFAEPAGDSRWTSRLAERDPCNPFCSAPYFAVMQEARHQTWVLGVACGDTLEAGCGAFARSGKLNRYLEIHSAPHVPGMLAFWDGLLGFCREHRITHLGVNSFASAGAVLPALPGEQGRVRRWECVMDLGAVDLWERLHTKHKQRVRKARKAGVKVLAAAGEHSCEQHVALIRASMERRRSRGEFLSDPSETEIQRLLIRQGAAELFQAVRNGEVLSSVLVTVAAKGAYSHTAGTSPEGMACGASHLLNYEIARGLQSRSMDIYNLGGVQNLDSGLAEYKLRFGARLVELEAADFFLGGRLRKGLNAAARWVREIPPRLTPRAAQVSS